MSYLQMHRSVHSIVGIARQAFARSLVALAALALATAPSLAQQPCTDVNIAQIYGGAAIDPGIDDIGLHCDDCTIPITFPFPVRFYGHYYNTANVSSNGNLQFLGNSDQLVAECLPTRNMDTAIFPYWDDLTLVTPGDGVFTSVTGDAPNRVFNVEWRAHYYARAGTANFEVRFFESSRNFEFVYGVTSTAAGLPFTIGVQKNHGELFRYKACNFSSAPAVGARILWSESPTDSYGTITAPRAFPVGTTDIGNHCDDCATQVTFPFPITFYHHDYTSAYVTSNGVVEFGEPNADYLNTCLPNTNMGPALMVHWDDLRTDVVAGQGIFTNVSGSAPSRTFDIEWRARLFSTSAPINFTVRFFEGLEYYELYYNTVPGNAANATVGMQAGDERFGEFACDSSAIAASTIVTMSLPPAKVYSPNASNLTGTTDIGNHCDDCTTNLALPFPVNIYGQTFTSANISSNGNIQFESNNAAFSNTCLPSPNFGTTIFAHWDDLRTDVANSGIFTRILGNAPNRILVINWLAKYFSTGADAQFSVLLYEETPRFDLYLYNATQAGASATVGVQNSDGSRFLNYSCNSTGRVPAWISISCLVPECVADVDDGSGTGIPDGGVTIDDLLYYLRIFEAGDISCDVDDGSGTGTPDGGVTIDDLLYFLARFESGC